MKAQVIHRYGDASELKLEDVPRPDVGRGEVRVRIEAIGINPLETKLRSGSLADQMPTRFPAILGIEAAGEVVAIGEGVSTLEVGDRVAGLALSGAYAEFAVSRSNAWARMPSGLSFERAATLPTAVETAQRVIELLEPASGETVVVNGAAGAVGSAAVQLMVRDGVKVIGTASDGNHRYLGSLGALATTYGPGVVERIRDLAPDGVDAVFDSAGHGFADAAIALRGSTRRIVTISDFAAEAKGITVSMGDAHTIDADAFAFGLELAAAGEFATEISQLFDFEEIAAAHALSEAGHLRGKIIVRGPV